MMGGGSYIEETRIDADTKADGIHEEGEYHRL